MQEMLRVMVIEFLVTLIADFVNKICLNKKM